MKRGRIWLFALVMTASVSAEEYRIFYDFVDGGQLKGGRLIVDSEDPVAQAVFGLGGGPRGAGGPWPVTTIVNNGPSTNRVDLVILGDGYMAVELGAYATQVNNVRVGFFAQEPLAAYSTYFNVHRVDVESNESGVDEIDLNIYRDTALDMAYGCYGIDRLLCIDVGKAYMAAASAPDVDQILALANSTRYGGAGYPDNDLGTLAGNNSASIEIALHEFGHSFADLADEYDYGDGATYTGPEPIEPNVSIYTAAQQVAQQRKWWRWMDLPNVDTHQGAYYNQFGIYRPTFNSKMRSLSRPFEQVNVEQFVVGMYRTVSPIDGATPLSGQPLSPCTEFFVQPLVPTDHALQVQWSVDGATVPGAVATTFTPDHDSLSVGLHQVGVLVVDNTNRVRDESLRTQWMTETRQWTVRVRLYGDVDDTDVVDVDDLVCTVAGYSNYTFCPGGDISPCEGDGQIDVDDLTALVNAYGGYYFCPNPC